MTGSERWVRREREQTCQQARHARGLEVAGPAEGWATATLACGPQELRRGWAERLMGWTVGSKSIPGRDSLRV